MIRPIDRHIVVNLREFITPKTQHLTQTAKRNLSACCVGIQYIGESKCSSNKRINCTLDIILKAVGFMESGSPKTREQTDAEQDLKASRIDSEIERTNGILLDLPGNFSGSQTVTELCIGLHLHPWFTEDLLRKAGIIPKATKQDSAYRYLYTVHYKDSIEDCNKYLRARGLQEFKLREKSA